MNTCAKWRFPRIYSIQEYFNFPSFICLWLKLHNFDRSSPSYLRIFHLKPSISDHIFGYPVETSWNLHSLPSFLSKPHGDSSMIISSSQLPQSWSSAGRTPSLGSEGMERTLIKSGVWPGPSLNSWKIPYQSISMNQWLVFNRKIFGI